MMKRYIYISVISLGFLTSAPQILFVQGETWEEMIAAGRVTHVDANRQRNTVRPLYVGKTGLTMGEIMNNPTNRFVPKFLQEYPTSINPIFGGPTYRIQDEPPKLSPSEAQKAGAQRFNTALPQAKDFELRTIRSVGQGPTNAQARKAQARKAQARIDAAANMRLAQPRSTPTGPPVGGGTPSPRGFGGTSNQAAAPRPAPSRGIPTGPGGISGRLNGPIGLFGSMAIDEAIDWLGRRREQERIDDLDKDRFIFLYQDHINELNEEALLRPLTPNELKTLEILIEKRDGLIKEKYKPVGDF